MIIYYKIAGMNLIYIRTIACYYKFKDRCKEELEGYYFKDLKSKENTWEDCGIFSANGNERRLWGIKDTHFDLFNFGQNTYIRIKTIFGMWLYEEFFL